MNAKAISIAALLFGAACCHADTIGSYATGASSMGNINTATFYTGFSLTDTITNGPPSPTFLLNPLNVWIAPPSNSTWVGYAATAGPLSGVNPPSGFYTFTSNFSVGGAWSGSLTVDADDTTAVFLNGVEIIGAGALGGDMHCADNVPNCTMTDTVGISGGTGLNNLTFLVTQAGQQDNTDDPSGLAFGGNVNIVPEPPAFMLSLLGTGLLFAGRLFKKFSM